MRQIIEYFDRAYIINLADRADRRRAVEREFRKAGIGVPNERVRFFTATRPNDKVGFKDVGTRGNFTRHRGVVELAPTDSPRRVLILEDDVSFRTVNEDFQRRILARLAQEDWDVVYFGYLFPEDDALEGPLNAWPNDILGAHFYAVNGRFIS